MKKKTPTNNLKIINCESNHQHQGKNNIADNGDENKNTSFSY
jgi:hypothetical protein